MREAAAGMSAVRGLWGPVRQESLARHVSGGAPLEAGALEETCTVPVRSLSVDKATAMLLEMQHRQQQLWRKVHQPASSSWPVCWQHSVVPRLLPLDGDGSAFSTAVVAVLLALPMRLKVQAAMHCAACWAQEDRPAFEGYKGAQPRRMSLLLVGWTLAIMIGSICCLSSIRGSCVSVTSCFQPWLMLLRFRLFSNLAL